MHNNDNNDNNNNENIEGKLMLHVILIFSHHTIVIDGHKTDGFAIAINDKLQSNVSKN